MVIKSAAIVLSSLRYGESDLIVSLFTKTSGLCSYLIRGVLKSKKGKIRASLFQPLTLLEIESYHKNNGTLERIREAKIQTPYKTIHTDLIKNSLVFFLSEIIKNAIKEEETNEDLFVFLETTLKWLDVNEDVSNFHISFMLKLTMYLGFYPDISQSNLSYFNSENGCFQSHDTDIYCRGGVYIENFKKFFGINFDEGMKIKLSRNIRREILQMLLVYFELHLHGFKKPKSLLVLNEIFN